MAILIAKLSNITGGLGPATLVGSATFDLFPIHGICVMIPKAGEVKKISDLRVWIVELFWSFWAYIWLYITLEVWSLDIITSLEALLTVIQFGERIERPVDWVPAEVSPHKNGEDGFSLQDDCEGEEGIYFSSTRKLRQHFDETPTYDVLSTWKHQFVDAVMLEGTKFREPNMSWWRVARVIWHGLVVPWKLLFAFVPPYQIAPGWIAIILVESSRRGRDPEVEAVLCEFRGIGLTWSHGNSLVSPDPRPGKRVVSCRVRVGFKVKRVENA
ncbi:hypothetical protein OSB04_002731 [Centaurea solstitialis]|uniref:Uncharacterized protein n=1 Tax=Centaurea solstitialis TaxID=347529 RepID=A0AA38WTD4_9ASTR|nr:hypothetical protein OSB04_002731 [Centaurea solstitialis]